MSTPLTLRWGGGLILLLAVVASEVSAAEETTRQVPQNQAYIANRLQEPVRMILHPERSTYTLRPRENQSFSCPPILDAVAFSGGKVAFKVKCGKQYAVMGLSDAPELREVTTD